MFVDTANGEHRTVLTTTSNVFQTNGLNRETLSPVTLNVCVAVADFGNCIQMVPVTVQATWTGFGGITSFVDHFGLPPNGRAHPSFEISGQNQRQATVTGSLNGENLGQATFALMFIFRDFIIGP